MKHTIILSISFFILLYTDSFAQSINTAEDFPDPNFRAVVEVFVGVRPGGEFTAEQAAAKTGMLNCSHRQVSDMTGLGYFTGVTRIDCSYNQITSLEVSQNTALTFLMCGGNQLTNLDISRNTLLERLSCFDNQLTSLDVSQNTLLKEIRCLKNQIESLDVSTNTVLEDLDCRDNRLTVLNVSGASALEWLECDNNQLTSLDVSDNTALGHLVCSDNQLTQLDVSGVVALTHLECQHNRLTNLDLSNAAALNGLHCEWNRLRILDLSGATALTYITCYDNQLTTLDVSNHQALTSLHCDNNLLTNLNVSGATSLTSLHCGRNCLTDLDVSTATALTYLGCGYNRLITVDVSNNPDLKGFNIGLQNTGGGETDVFDLGYCLDVALSEDEGTLYAACGQAGTHVLSVDAPGLTYVRTVSSHNGYHENIAVNRDHAYFGDSQWGLVVLDVSTPDSPIDLCVCAPASGTGIFVSDGCAYMTTGSGLQIIDISDPGEPWPLGYVDTPGNAWDVCVAGNYAYVADWEAGIAVIDVSSPSQPRYLKNICWSDGDDQAHAILASGETLYVASAKHGLVMVDISDLWNPEVIGIFKVSSDGKTRGIAVKESTVYLGNSDSSQQLENGLYIVETSDPAHPEVVGALNFGDTVEGIVNSGNLLFVANGWSGVRVIDVSHPQAPEEIFHWSGQRPEDVASVSEYVLY
ncbi:MAG: hypothetical protein ABIH23_31570 [bacterium]